MIGSFSCCETKKIFNRKFSKKIEHAIQTKAYRKLLMIKAATTLSDLKSPPGNHLEKLKGNRNNEYSIRINDKWRICFLWKDGYAHNIKIEDYH